LVCYQSPPALDKGGLASSLASVGSDDLGIFPPITPLDWAHSCVKDVDPVVGLSCDGYEDPTVALLIAIEKYHSREVKGACSRGKRELLNLECSINYESTSASSRRGKGKAYVFSVERFVWVSGLRAFVVLWVFGILRVFGVLRVFGICGFLVFFRFFFYSF
jgi:hypothetical protein